MSRKKTTSKTKGDERKDINYNALDLTDELIYNITRNTEQNDYETKANNYANMNINPPFRYYNTDIDLSPAFSPQILYKNKSMFGREKPSQTEHDEIGINEPYLNKYYGYTDYGNWLVANQSLPETNKVKLTPANCIYDLV